MWFDNTKEVTEKSSPSSPTLPMERFEMHVKEMYDIIVRNRKYS